MTYLQFWYQSYRAPFGVIIETNDRHALKQRLYAARREADDPDLEGISIVMDPVYSNRLWLIKRSPSDGPELGTT